MSYVDQFIATWAHEHGHWPDPLAKVLIEDDERYEPPSRRLPSSARKSRPAGGCWPPASSLRIPASASTRRSRPTSTGFGRAGCAGGLSDDLRPPRGAWCMTETPQQIVWRLEQECIRLRARAERAEARAKRAEAKLKEAARV